MVKCYNPLTDRSVSNKKGGNIISTKEKIKKEALTLFARKGYYGTSINDIANAVGLTKSSLYAHYSSKDDLYLAVFADISQEYRALFKQLSEASINMEVKDKLAFHFKEYILFLYRNPEISRFLNTGLFHIPSDLHNILRTKYLSWELSYRKSLEDIFAEGIRNGIIRKGDPVKKVWSFKTKRDGVGAWLSGSPDLTVDSIEEFWNDFWFGVTEKKEDN